MEQPGLALWLAVASTALVVYLQKQRVTGNL
jgi:hypothetical protein